MNNGKNFNIFLMDGEVTGRIKCTLSNWTGLVYKIPRPFLEKCKDRQDLKQISTNILAKMGKDEPIAMDSLAKIAAAMQCRLDDIVEIQKDGDE